MCGLVAVLSKKGRPAGQYAFDLYKKQATRGRQGYGYLAIHDNKLVGVHRSKDEAGIRSLLNKEKAEMIMFHHRFPTSTSNTVGTTHPMFVSHDELEHDYYFAHNGIISNASELKKKHNELGYQYRTEYKEFEIAEYLNGDIEPLSVVKSKFNDSESLAIELARHLEGLTEDLQTKGPIAFWGVALEKGTKNVVKTFFGKNKGRDLCCITNKKWFAVTSESGYDIEDMIINVMDMNTYDIELKPFLVDEAKPTPATTRTHTHVGFRDEADYVFAYDNLEDKEYTYTEVTASGVPYTEFTREWRGAICYYRPTKFVNIQKQMALPVSRDIKSKEEDAEDEEKKKAMERLEELAGRYAKKRAELDKVEECYEKGDMGEAFYTEEYTRIDGEIGVLETQMSVLGIDPEVVDTVVETSLELEDFNSTYEESWKTYNSKGQLIND